MWLLHSKSVGAFVIRFLVIYGLMMTPCPGVRRAYAAVFNTGGNLLFGSFGREGEVRFGRPPQNDGEFDTEIILTRRTAKGFAQQRIPPIARTLGYMPTAMMVALVVATASPWKRRRWALVWGLAFVHAFIALRVGLLLVEAFSQDTLLRLYTLSAFWEKALNRAIPALVRAPAGSYIIPIMIWILVSFRASDFASRNARTQKR